MKECKIDECHRDTIDELCIRHTAALTSLEQMFDAWKIAYGEKYSKTKYMEALLKDDNGVGIWVQEIIKFKLQED